MKRPINLFFLLLMMTTLSISCTKDSDVGEGGRHSSSSSDSLLRGEELYNQVADELYDYLYNHDGATIHDIQEQLKKYSSLVTSEVKDNILYLTIDSIYEQVCDPYGMTCPIGNEDFTEETEDFEKLMTEIHDALYPDEADSHTRSGSLWDFSIGKSSTRAEGADVILTKHELYVWDPWQAKRADFNSMTHMTDNDIKDGRTLNDMKTFGNYDIVLLICHGASDGCIGVPQNSAYLNELEDPALNLKFRIDYIDGSIGTGPNATKAYILKKSALEKFLIGNLSETILWTSMCFANASGSVLKSRAKELGVPAFAGADKTVYMNGKPQVWLGTFANYFYNNEYPLYAGTCAQRTFKASSNDAPVTVRYDRPENGVYSFEYYKHIQYKPLVEVQKEVENQPRARIVTSSKSLRAASANPTRGLGATRTSSNNISAGFWIRDKETKEITEIEFNSSTVKQYGDMYYYPKEPNKEKEIVRIEVLGNTDDLDEGTYEYKTYLEIDGKKEYSEETYEFEVKRINKVVPEWLLEMMEPYIPIYEGDNPPIIEGTYLLSPQKLFYDSSKQYSSGRVFADNYLFFTDQDEVKDTINFVGFEVNSYGDIISEKYGEGAFISGEGNNFSIFFNTAGEHYYNNGYSYSLEALIVSGTKTSTGIKDIYYAFAMVDKYDPYNNLMPKGAFRIFKDGDGLADYIDLNDATRTRSNINSQAQLLPSIAANGNSTIYQRGIPFYEWKNRINVLKGIRIKKGGKVTE